MVFRNHLILTLLFLSLGLNAGNTGSCCNYNPPAQVHTIYYMPSEQNRFLGNEINQQESSRASVASSEESVLNQLAIQRMNDHFQFNQRNLSIHREVRTQELRTLLAARARDNQRFRQIVEELEQAGQPIDTNAIDRQIQEENAANR